MCVTIATTFTVAWTPFQLNRIVVAYGNRYHALLILDAIESLAFINSCVNPIIYAFMWRPFRLSLVQVRRSLSVILPTETAFHVVVSVHLPRP